VAAATIAVCALVALAIRYRRKYMKAVNQEPGSGGREYQELKSELHNDAVQKRRSELRRAPVAEPETLIGKVSSLEKGRQRGYIEIPGAGVI